SLGFALDKLVDIAIDSVLSVVKESDGKLKADKDDIQIVKKIGKSLNETELIKGVVVDKEVVHAAMPKRVENARIALIDSPFEIEKTEFDAKLNIETPEQMRAFMKQEEEMLRQMVEKISAAGANVVLCQKGIDDLAQYFLAKKGIMAVRRIKKSDMDKLAKATKGRVISRIDDLTSEDLGYASLVEERRVGEDKMVFVEGCENPKSLTILIRGGTQRIVDEAERSLKDAINVVKDVIVEGKVIPGGGAGEIEVAMRLRDYAKTLPGKEQLAVNKFAEALEVIPSQLAESSGMDPIEAIVNLTSKHKEGHITYGINVFKSELADMKQLDVLDPLLVKKQTIKSAVEAAAMVLKIDDIIAASRLETPGAGKKGESKEEGGVGESED
ncbi:MAG: thermosome subunit, partial [Candidatus Caldarchaeum sp.]|nr:thermosome subunit [Candidatus Caldarchaeum sp.]MDW8436008.1 thermosome subunit beta [Candidatus Caldarchaeum sp.]